MAALSGGWVDRLITRAIDVVLAVPSLVLALAVVGLLGPGLRNLLIALLISSWASDARVTRALALEATTKGYVQAAIGLGVSRPTLGIRHVLPDVIGRVLVISTMRLGGIVVSLAGLSFLGLGVQEPLTSWGALISEGAGTMNYGTLWQLAFPLGFFVVTLFAFFFVGDGLRDALDPKDR